MKRCGRGLEDKERGRQGENSSLSTVVTQVFSPCLPLSLSPCLADPEYRCEGRRKIFASYDATVTVWREVHEDGKKTGRVCQ
jgi:hypothetical protein